MLESRDDGLTVATVLEVPNLRTTDKTKQGAIAKVRQLLQKRLAKADARKQKLNLLDVLIQALSDQLPVFS